MIKKILRATIAFPKSILFAVLLVCMFLGYYSTKLEIDASSQTLLLENDKDLEIWREVSKRYQTPNFLVIAYVPKNDLLDKESVLKIKNISNEIEEFDFVESVINITNVPLLENKNQTVADLVKHVPTLNDLDIDMQAARREFKTSPFYASNLVSKDLKTTAIVINLKPNLKYDNFIRQRDILFKKDANGTISDVEKAELSKINKEFKIYRDENRIKEHEDIVKLRNVLNKYRNDGRGEGLFLGGVNMIADDMISFVKNDVRTYGAAAFMLLILCLWLFFRQIRFVAVPVAICIISVICASGLFGFLGYEITVISSNYVALQLIITISVVIHLIVSYREYATNYPRFTQKQILYLALNDRIKPCFFAIFTTVVGFISLVLCDIKPVIMLGVMMSVGISISLIIAFIVFGSIMSLLDKTAIRHSFEDSFKFTQFCADLVLKKRNLIYLSCILSIVIGAYGISKLKVENSFIGYFKESTEIYAGMAIIDQELGGTVPLDIVVKFKDKNDEFKSSGDEFLDSFESEFAASKNDAKYWFSSHKMRIITKIHNFLKDREFIGNVSSLASLLEVGKRLNDGKKLDDFMLAVMYNELPQKYKNIVLSPYISIENNEAHFALRTVDSDKNLRRDEFLKSLDRDLKRFLKDEDVEIQISGTMVLYNNMLQSLMHSQIDTLGFVVLSLFTVFVFLFRSIKFALIAIVVNLIPLCLVFGIMGILKIPLDIMSITIAAISIGIGVDDVIHYIHRYKIELRTHKKKERAVLLSHASIGYAMYYTSFAIFLGFSVMTISNFWPTIYFGLLIDLVMALLLLGALLILPSFILSWTGEFKKA